MAASISFDDSFTTILPMSVMMGDSNTSIWLDVVGNVTCSSAWESVTGRFEELDFLLNETAELKGDSDHNSSPLSILYMSSLCSSVNDSFLLFNTRKESSFWQVLKAFLISLPLLRADQFHTRAFEVYMKCKLE